MSPEWNLFADRAVGGWKVLPLLLVPLRFEPLSIGKVTFIWIPLSRSRATPQRKWSERISRAGQGWRHENGIPFTFIFHRRFTVCREGCPLLASLLGDNDLLLSLWRKGFDWWRTLMRLAEDSPIGDSLPRIYRLSRTSRELRRGVLRVFAWYKWLIEFHSLYPIRCIKSICSCDTTMFLSLSARRERERDTRN